MKPKIFYLAWTEPSSNSGACLAMYRHFIIKKDFDVIFATDKNLEYLGSRQIYLKRNRLHKRLSRTRFRKIMAQYEMLVEPYLICRKCQQQAEEFNPDAIFTIPDNTLSWAAYLLSKKLKKPLITNFQDWWPRGQFWSEAERPIPCVRKTLENRFRIMYRESIVAFATSHGMKKYLGEHPCAPVLYPCPAFRNGELKLRDTPKTPGIIHLVYAGTIVRYYGQRVLQLAKALETESRIRLHIYGHRPDWNVAEMQWVNENGIYHGFLPYEKLRQELVDADVFLVVMSHAPEVRLMMETSFTTKFLDAAQFGKPIIVWGPDYSTAIKLAKEKKIAVTITSERAEDVVENALELLNADQYRKYSLAAIEAATSIFDPEKIHQILRENIYAALGFKQ